MNYLTKKNYEDLMFTVYKTFENCFVVTRKNAKDQSTYAMFENSRKQRALFHYHFRNDEDRDNLIKQTVREINQKIENDKKLKALKKEKEENLNIEIGTIFNTSWGYGQTNVEYYQVVGFKGKTVKLRELNKKYDNDNSGHGDMCGYYLPIKDDFANDEILTKRVKYNTGSNRLTIRINEVATAWLWDGRSNYVSWYN